LASASRPESHQRNAPQLSRVPPVHRAVLRGCDSRAELASGNQPSGHGYVRQHAYLPAPDTERLRAAAKRLKMPPNVLMQAVWSVLMAHYSGRQEAMFGVYLNGRPTELPKVENIAGPTMSIPPMRIVLPPPDRPVTDLLEQVMRAGIDIAHHQYVAPGQFSHWAGMPEGKTLFDNYMVFQNLYPNQWMSPSPLSFVITRMSAPIRVDIMPGIKVGVVLYYERSLLSDESARTVLTDFLRALAALASDANGGSLPAESARPRSACESPLCYSPAPSTYPRSRSSRSCVSPARGFPRPRSTTR